MTSSTGAEPGTPRLQARARLLTVLLVIALVVIVGLTVALVDRSRLGATTPTPEATTGTPTTQVIVPVEITGCFPISGDLGMVMTITNPTNGAHGYAVKVAFDSADGTKQLATATAGVRTLQPHEQSQLQAQALVTATTGYRCRIISADQG